MSKNHTRGDRGRALAASFIADPTQGQGLTHSITPKMTQAERIALALMAAERRGRPYHAKPVTIRRFSWEVADHDPTA